MENFVFIVFTDIDGFQDFDVFDDVFKAQDALSVVLEKVIASNMDLDEDKARKEFKKHEKHWFDIKLEDGAAYGCIRKRRVK